MSESNVRSERQPVRPSRVSDYARACLEALSAAGMGPRISLGGAFGLLHYLDYRSTHDVDAWWNPATSAEERAQLVRLLEDALSDFGPVRTRRWGDVVSVELLRAGQEVFSFQIASRSAQLEESSPSPWGVPLDSLADLAAAKTVALVERGAPRDFRDIYALCQSGLLTPEGCWELWRRRQEMVGSDASYDRARLAVETHLERIAQHRPLAGIADDERRAEAEAVRRWFREVFLYAAS